MKRFWLFHFSYFYPGGGMVDFVDSYDDQQQAIESGCELVRERSHGHSIWSEAHVVDCTTGVRSECEVEL